MRFCVVDVVGADDILMFYGGIGSNFGNGKNEFCTKEVVSEYIMRWWCGQKMAAAMAAVQLSF